MEFDSKFAIIQGVLKRQEKIHGKLTCIDSDEEDKIISIKEEISKAVKDQHLDSNDQRRLFLFLLFNTDNDYYSSICDDENCGHVVGSIPKLSKTLFIELAAHLKLENVIYESVIFLPSLLGLEVIDMCMMLLKSTKDPFKLFEYIETISRAILVKLFFLDSSTNESDTNAHMLNEADKDFKFKFFCYLQTVIDNFSSTNTDRYKSWEKDKLDYFCAFIMKSILSIVNTCCERFLNPDIVAEEFQNIYNVNCKGKLKKNVKTIEVDDIKKTSLQIILSKFLLTAKNVTISLWMSWLELEEFTDENMQTVIGNSVYHCLEYFKNERIQEAVNKHMFSEIMMITSNMSIKPIDEQDLINTADIPTILENVNDPQKSGDKWLSALIHHRDFTPDSLTLKVIEEKSHLIVRKDVETLIDNCILFLKQGDGGSQQSSELRDQYKTVVLCAIRNFHVDNQIVIMQSFFTKNGLTDILKTEEFDISMVKLFNTVVEDNTLSMESFADYISLGFQSPEALLKKIVKEALASTHQGKLMVNTLKHLRPICEFKLKEANDEIFLTRVLKECTVTVSSLTDCEKENFSLFVVGLVNKSLIPGDDFLNKCLFLELTDAMRRNEYTMVLLWLDLLQKFVDGSVNMTCLELNMPVHIIFLCQIIDRFRCSLSSFSFQSVAVCDKALAVLIEHLENFNAEEQPVIILNWMKHQLQSVDIITQLHVLSFINHAMMDYLKDNKSTEVHWLKLIIWESEEDLSFLQDIRRAMFIRVICKVLPYFTLREWKIMFTNLAPKEDAASIKSLFLATADAVLMLQSAVMPNLTDECLDVNVINSSTNCICFIMKNLIYIIQDLIFPHARKMGTDDLADIFLKICLVLNKFPEAIQNNQTLVWLKILQDLISFVEFAKPDETPKFLLQKKKICAGIGMITNAELRKSLSNIVLTSIKVK